MVLLRAHVLHLDCQPIALDMLWLGRQELGAAASRIDSCGDEVGYLGKAIAQDFEQAAFLIVADHTDAAFARGLPFKDRHLSEVLGPVAPEQQGPDRGEVAVDRGVRASLLLEGALHVVHPMDVNRFEVWVDTPISQDAELALDVGLAIRIVAPAQRLSDAEEGEQRLRRVRCIWLDYLWGLASELG